MGYDVVVVGVCGYDLLFEVVVVELVVEFLCFCCIGYMGIVFVVVDFFVGYRSFFLFCVCGWVLVFLF